MTKQQLIYECGRYLTEANYQIFHPLIAPKGFDFIIYDGTTMARVVARSSRHTGKHQWTVDLRTSKYADGHTVKTFYGQEEFDYLICLDNRKLYLIPRHDIPDKVTLSLSKYEGYELKPIRLQEPERKTTDEVYKETVEAKADVITNANLVDESKKADGEIADIFAVEALVADTPVTEEETMSQETAEKLNKLYDELERD